MLHRRLFAQHEIKSRRSDCNQTNAPNTPTNPAAAPRDARRLKRMIA
jgi:hypothetical protein